jgi:hypothetical protein
MGVEEQPKIVKIVLPEGVEQVAIRDLNRSNDARKTRTCIRCRTQFERGEWCFYDLCDTCFDLFDSQKMKGRWRTEGTSMTHFEDAEAWSKANPV